MSCSRCPRFIHSSQTSNLLSHSCFTRADGHIQTPDCLRHRNLLQAIVFSSFYDNGLVFISASSIESSQRLDYVQRPGTSFIKVPLGGEMQCCERRFCSTQSDPDLLGIVKYITLNNNVWQGASRQKHIRPAAQFVCLLRLESKHTR